MLSVASSLLLLVAIMWWVQRRRAPAYRRLIDAMKLHDRLFWETLGRPDGSGWDFSHAFGWRTPFYTYLMNRDFARSGRGELSDAGEAYRRIELRTVPTAIVAWLLLSAVLSEVIARTLA